MAGSGSGSGFSALQTLGPDKADQVCQDVISHTKPTQGPANLGDTLTTLGIPDAPAVIVLINMLVSTARTFDANLNPTTLKSLAPTSTYKTMLDMVAAAPLIAS